MKRFFIYTALLAASGVLQAAPVSVKDVSGKTVTLPSYPQRIVSLSPAVTEILFAIGAGGQVAGVTEYCNYPPEAAGKTKIGGFSGATVSIETIALLKPDLVVLSADMHFRVISLLERVSISVFAVEPRNFADVYETISSLGQITGHEREASSVINEMKKKIETAAALRTGKTPVTVYWEVYPEPIMTAGGGTFISEAITLAGGKNIFADTASSYPQVSAEEVLVRRPDWLLAPDDSPGEFSAAVLSRRPGWQTLAALKQNHIAQIPGDIISRYGPRLADAVTIITNILWR